MSAEALKEFVALLGFEIDEAGARKFTSWLGTATARTMAFGAGIMTAAGAVYAGVYKIAEGNAELLSTAESLGMGVARLRELNFVANVTGASAEALKSSLQGLKSAMAGATIGQGGIATFARLGIQIRDDNGHLRDTADVLDQVGKRIKTMNRPRAEMFLGQLGIDKSLYRMLTQDVGGLTDAYREMYAATGMDAQRAAEQSRGFVQEVKILKEVFKLLAETIGIALIGKAGRDVTDFRRMLLANFKQILAVLLTFIQLILRVAGFFGALTIRIGGWIGSIVRWFQGLDGTTQTLILSVLGFAAAWKFLNLSFLATPLGRLIALGVAIVALIDDFQTWLEGGESLLDWGDGMTQLVVGLIAGVGGLVTAMNVLPPIIAAVTTGGEILAGAVGAVTTALRVMSVAAAANPFMAIFLGAALVASLIITNWETVKSWFTAFMDWIGSKFSWVLEAARSAARIMGSGAGGSGGSPALAPSSGYAMAAAGAAGAGGKIELNATTQILVDGAGDPEAVGRAVLGGQQKTNADMVRNMRGVVR